MRGDERGVTARVAKFEQTIILAVTVAVVVDWRWLKSKLMLMLWLNLIVIAVIAFALVVLLMVGNVIIVVVDIVVIVIDNSSSSDITVATFVRFVDDMHVFIDVILMRNNMMRVRVERHDSGRRRERQR